MSDGRRTRVGVAPSVTMHAPGSSTHRMWTAVLGELGKHVDIVVAPPQRRRFRPPPRVDVWLSDGHDGPVATRRPVVAHLHEASWDDPDLTPLFDPAFVARFGPQSRAAAQQAACIITPSEAAAEQVRRAYGVAPDRVLAAPHGVDHQVFRPRGDDEVATVLRRWEVEVPYVLCVASAHPRKNLGALRDAMQRLRARGLPHRLVLVAAPAADGGAAASLLPQLTAPLAPGERPVDNLVGIGDEELAAVYSGAAALCLPSLMEGFGLPVAEAMACGTPVVVSDRGALPEVVGDAGAIVSPEPGPIADALAAILTDRSRHDEAVARGRTRAAELTWAAAAERWLAALRIARRPLTSHAS